VEFIYLRDLGNSQMFGESWGATHQTLDYFPLDIFAPGAPVTAFFRFVETLQCGTYTLALPVPLGHIWCVAKTGKIDDSAVLFLAPPRTRPSCASEVHVM
jgi:hypothetical protein